MLYVFVCLYMCDVCVCVCVCLWRVCHVLIYAYVCMLCVCFVCMYVCVHVHWLHVCVWILRKSFYMHNSKTHFSPSHDNSAHLLTVHICISTEISLSYCCCCLFLNLARYAWVVFKRIHITWTSRLPSINCCKAG